MRRRTALTLLLTVVATLAPMETAQACSCIPSDPARFLAESDFVFAGSLIEQPNVGFARILGLAGGHVPHPFEIDAVYKGDIRDSTIEIWAAPTGAACGFGVPVGKPVAIAASLSGGRLTSSSCFAFGVDELEVAAEEAGIEPVMPDATGSVGKLETANSPVLPIAAGVAVLASVVAVVLAISRRRGGAA